MNLGAMEEASAGNQADNRIDSRPVLIVTGLVQEARIAAGPGMTVICSSSDPQQLRALLTVFDPSTIRGVSSSMPAVFAASWRTAVGTIGLVAAWLERSGLKQ